MNPKLNLQFCFLLLMFLIPVISIAQSSPIYFTVDPSLDPINQALEALGLTRQTCAFPISGAAAPSERSLECPSYRYLFHNPFQIPYVMGHIEYNFECYRDNLLRTMIFMTGRVGAGVARGYFTSPLADLEKRLNEAKPEERIKIAVAEIYASSGKSLSDDEAKKILDAVRDVPERVQMEAARLLITSAQAVRWQRKALEKALKSDYKHLLDNIPRRLTPPMRPDDRIPTISEEWERDAQSDLRPILDLVDLSTLISGAQDLMSSLEKTRAAFAAAPVAQKFHAEFDTPIGLVVLNGAGETNKYQADDNYLLIMDFGGDDEYSGGGANRSAAEPVSILLDFDGNDSYIQTSSAFAPAFGAGVLGYGFLFDFVGNDKYVSLQMTQGCGFFGVGWLVDFGGNDAYECIRFGQGMAHAGLGLLYDRSGDDVYYCYNSAQGCGRTQGCGMLVDEAGDDQYIANNSDIRFSAAQDRRHNRSEAQGAGMGERADEKDGHSLPGGIGILMDKSGNDKYTAAIFAQGMSFWSGVGFLIDSGGDDQYSGVWYVQGVGVHGGIGALCDRDGNDSYTATLHASQGVGHDSSIGFFIDEKGDDIYQSPRLSLGCANENSIALFLDMQGNDRYVLSSSDAMGHAQFSKFGTMREDQLGVGIFIDAGGAEDEYNGPRGMQNRLWVQPPSQGIKLKSELGAGIDGDFDRVDLRLRPLTKKPPNVDW